jgi:cytochrome c biogenesis protein CcdA
MVLFAPADLGGVLTIVSPCILPVVLFVFASADRPFIRSGLPTLIGIAATFAVGATLAAVAGGWAVEANQYGRAAAILLLWLFGVACGMDQVFAGMSVRLPFRRAALDRWWESVSRRGSAKVGQREPPQAPGFSRGAHSANVPSSRARASVNDRPDVLAT